MIRFIDLGKQIAVDETDPNWPRQFAFYDTVHDRFISINGYMVFDSLADLISEIEQNYTDAEFANRLLNLLPDWAKVMRVANPRMSCPVFGLSHGVTPDTPSDEILGKGWKVLAPPPPISEPGPVEPPRPPRDRWVK